MGRKRKRVSHIQHNHKYHGLKNQGATCYLNSVLQVLFMTKGFREAVKRCSAAGRIDRHLASVFTALEKHTAQTSEITQALGIKVCVQRDAAEYFEKILYLTSPEASQVFQILLSSRSKCRGCPEETSTDERFWSLPLTLLESHSDVYKVVDGIQEFFSTSVLKGEDQIFCERCEAKRDTKIKFEIKRHPDVLTLMLKRFKFDPRSNHYVKIQRSVEIPHAITIKSHKYELYAFVEHSGGLKSGHYTATIKSEDDEKWYGFNDTTVTMLSYQPLQVDPSHRSRDAYLLFYRKEKKTSSGDEASPPAASKQETCGLSDPSGNAVKTGEKEDEEATEGVKHVTDSEGKRVTADEEREERILLNGKIVSEDKDRSMTVDEGRDEGKSPADVEEEEETKKRAAGDRKSAGEYKTNKKLQTIYDLINSPPGNTSSEKSDTRHEEERNEENYQSKSIFHADVQDTAAVNSDSNNDCTAKDETSGRDYSSDQVKRARVEENHTDKPTDGKACRSPTEKPYSEDLMNESKEGKEMKRDDDLAQTTEKHGSSQAAEGENEIQSGGNLQMRPQEEMRREDVSETRYNRGEEEMSDTMQSKKSKESSAEETWSSSEELIRNQVKPCSECDTPDRNQTKERSESCPVNAGRVGKPSVIDPSFTNPNLCDSAVAELQRDVSADAKNTRQRTNAAEENNTTVTEDGGSQIQEKKGTQRKGSKKKKNMLFQCGIPLPRR